MTEDIILNSDGFVGGEKYECFGSNPKMERTYPCTKENAQNGGGQFYGLNKTKIVFGDLDNNGKTEAAMAQTVCAGSCGLSIKVFKLIENGERVVADEVPTMSVARTAKSITNLKINGGCLQAKLSDFGGERNVSLEIKFVGDQVVIVN